MPRRPAKQEQWEYESLAWIHRARESLYESEKGVPLMELEPRPSRDAARLASRLKLKSFPAGERLVKDDRGNHRGAGRGQSPMPLREVCEIGSEHQSRGPSIRQADPPGGAGGKILPVGIAAGPRFGGRLRRDETPADQLLQRADWGRFSHGKTPARQPARTKKLGAK